MDTKQTENELQEMKDIRRKRAELMRRLYNAGYTYAKIGKIYGSNRQYVQNEITWLEKQEAK